MMTSQRYVFCVSGLILILVAALPSFAASTRSATAITVETCGETVERGQTAYLTQDLDCRGNAVPGVILADRARLVLAGHTILGDPLERDADDRPLQGVRCAAGSICTIVGPGAVVGFSASGIAGTRVRVREVQITDNAIGGISAFENVSLSNVSLAENGTFGVHAGGRVRAQDAELAGQNGAAIIEWHAPSIRPKRAPQH